MKHQTKRLSYAAALGVSALTAAALTWRSSTKKYPAYPASDHYDPTTRTFFNPEPLRPQQGMLSAFVMTALNMRAQNPPTPLPTVAPDWDAFLAPAASSRFIWFGHSTLMMRIGRQTVAADPVLGASVSPVPVILRRFQPSAANREELPPVDAVLISHNHYDHLEKPTVLSLVRRGAHLVVPLGVGVTLRAWGIGEAQFTELDWWQSVEREGVRYTAVPARHDSARSLFDRNKALWAGFVIEHLDDSGEVTERFYYHGDSGFGSHYAQIAARFSEFDIAFLENGQYNWRWRDNHLFPEQTAEVAALLRPKRFMPIHWGAYSLSFHPWNESVMRSVPLVRERGISPLTPRLGQVFDAHTVTDDWFAD